MDPPPAADVDRVEGEKLAAVIASLGDGLLVLDEGLCVETVNARGEEILGVSATWMAGRPVDELATRWRLRDRGPFAVSKMRHHLLRGIPYRNDDAFVVADDGTLVHVSLVMTPIHRDGSQHGAVICFRDITDIKLSQNRLRESELRLRRILEWAPTGMVRIAADGSIDFSNQAFQDMLGMPADALSGRLLAEVWHPDEAEGNGDDLVRLLDGELPTLQGEQRFLHADGSTVWTATAIARVGRMGGEQHFAIAVIEDGTERKRLEIELRHAQKLESVGRLAAGIAHEINTPVQFIGDNVRFMGEAFQTIARMAVPDALSPAERADLTFLTDEVPLAAQQTLDGIARVATIVQAMKTFGQPTSTGRTWTDVNEVVRTVLVVAARELAHVDVELALEDLPPVLCDAADLNQVLLHLVVNAADAIAEPDARGSAPAERGRIRLATRADEDGVEVVVADTGAGIPVEIRDRVFDPFFTTKEVGRGTGQGLALARALVVERHGGTLTFDSRIGEGTTFYLRLPCEATSPQRQPGSPAEPSLVAQSDG